MVNKYGYKVFDNKYIQKFYDIICINICDREFIKIIRDTSIAVTNIMNQAINLDLSTCWVAWFTQNEIRPILNIPNDKYVVGILTVGYADEYPHPRPRKNIEDIIHVEKW